MYENQTTISRELQSTKTREEFISEVQKWAILDTQLKIVNEKTRKMREMKSVLTKQICNYIDTNKLKTTIGISDGELKIYEKREYSPLSYGYIEECLKTIIKNPEHIEYIIKFLKDNREIKTVQDIRRTMAVDHTASL